MPIFRIPTTFAFNGTFRIRAENRNEAADAVKKSCGMTVSGGIHADLPYEDVGWEFPVHPEVTISPDNPTFLVGANADNEDTLFYLVEAMSGDAAAVTVLVALANTAHEEGYTNGEFTVSLVAQVEPGAQIQTLHGPPVKLSVMPPQAGSRIGVPYSIYRALRKYCCTEATSFTAPSHDEYAAQFDANGQIETMLHRTPPCID